VPYPADDRVRLLETVRARRACIDAYVKHKTPASTRLSTVSIVSSAIAAALTAGPALGGTTFAQTVQDGLNLDRPDMVWRILCFAALAVSITAAISANLSKSHDLTSRIAAAEQAGAVLERLQRRLEFPQQGVETDVQEVVREYGDVVAGIPFIPETYADSASSGEPERRRFGLGPSVAAVVAVLSAVLLVATLVGCGVGLAGSSSAPGPDSSTPAPETDRPTSSSPSTSASSSPAPEERAGVFAGGTDQGDATLAIVVDGGQASAYLCDGKQLEAWLNGPVVDSRLDLTSPSGARLTGEVTDAVVSGDVVTSTLTTAFRADLAGGAAGVYEANIEVNGAPARIGWAVLPDGTQVGLVNREGVRSEAPPLNTDDLSFTYNGAHHHAVRKAP
jgi:hypothetical protein